MVRKFCSKNLKNLLAILLGNMVYALAVKLFVLPANLLTGGTTGIALVLNQAWGLPISTVVLVINVVMLLLGWWIMGRAFAVSTVASTFLYPVFLHLLAVLCLLEAFPQAQKVKLFLVEPEFCLIQKLSV